MTQYPYSVSANFPNGILVSQLTQEIIDAIPTPELYDISVVGDAVTISFSASIPDVTVLNTVVANHVPVYYDYISPYVVDNVVTNKINNTEYSYFGNNKFSIIISQNGQSYYSTLGAAIADNNIPDQVFVMYPGTYIENNPLILPPGATIISTGSAVNTVLVSQNPALDLIVLNQNCKITGFTMVGSTGTGARGIYYDATQNASGSFSAIKECYIVNCNIGVECDGKNTMGLVDTLYASELVIAAKNNNTDKGVYCHSGAQFIGNVCYVYGVPSTYTVDSAYYCYGAGSKMTLVTASVWYCGIGLHIDNLANTEISVLNIQNNNIGCRIGSTGATTRLSASSLIFGGSATYDLEIQPTGANVEIYSSFLDDAKLHNPNDVNISIKYNAAQFGSYYQTILGDVQVGSPYSPSKFAAGEGLYINTGVAVLSNSNLESGTWVDNTVIALSSDSIPFDMFQSTAVDNCFYLGSRSFMYGFKINITTPVSSVIPQSYLTWEYWNGSAWVSFKAMQTYPATRNVYISSFLSLLSKFHIRFGLTSDTPFAMKTLNGMSLNWVRLRIATTLPSLPMGEYIKLHTSSAVINSNGYLEYFGNSRVVKNNELTWLPDASLTLPPQQEIFFSPGLTSSNQYNSFLDSVLTRVGFSFRMPIEMDISFPMKINIGFVCDSASTGDIQWTLQYTFSTTNTPMYLNATDAALNPNPNAVTVTKITSMPANNDKLNLNETFVIDSSLISSNPSTNVKSFFYATLTRDAQVSNGLDTYPGGAFLMTLDFDYIVWSSGGYILGF